MIDPREMKVQQINKLHRSYPVIQKMHNLKINNIKLTIIKFNNKIKEDNRNRVNLQEQKALPDLNSSRKTEVVGLRLPNLVRALYQAMKR